MSKKLMMITVRGDSHRWCFQFYGDLEYLQEWIDDGLDIVMIENAIPDWVVSFGLARAWCFAQDVFNFRNPFR